MLHGRKNAVILHPFSALKIGKEEGSAGTKFFESLRPAKEAYRGVADEAVPAG